MEVVDLEEGRMVADHQGMVEQTADSTGVAHFLELFAEGDMAEGSLLGA